MSDRMRWRYGDTNPVVAAVDSETVIEIGDLVYQETDDARPASALPDEGSLSSNQQMFTAGFLGVAMQRSRAGDSSPVRVATTGVFEFDCPLATFELGDLIGVDQNESNDGLLSQQVVAVGSGTRAIGRVARRVPEAAGGVLIDIRSKVMTGGV